MESIPHIIWLSLLSLFTLFLLTKIMGKRQMSELNLFDYINGITIGSIAAELSTSIDGNFLEPLTAMIVYALVTALISVITTKSYALRHFFNGKSMVLLNNGILYEKNLRKSKIDVNDFLSQCRVSGFFDTSQIQSAILEQNGKISFLPKTSNRPVTPNDLNLEPPEETLMANLIIDGKLMPESLSHSGKDEKWLKKQLATHGITSYSQVLLACCDYRNQLTVYKKTNENPPTGLFS